MVYERLVAYISALDIEDAAEMREWLSEHMDNWEILSSDSQDLIIEDWEALQDIDDAGSEIGDGEVPEPPEPEPPEPPEPEGGGFWNGVRDSISRVGESIRNLFRRD